MSDKVTIRKLAEELSLSPSTVYRALAGLASVRPETRRKVLHAAQRYGYRPSGPGPRNIAVIVPSFVFDGYLGCLLPCLEAEFLRRRMQLALISLPGLSQLGDAMFAGIVSLDWKLGLEKSLPKNFSVPIMTIGGVSNLMESVPSVMSDSHGIRMALDYLRAKGCRKIFYVSSYTENSPETNQRLAEFRQFCEETGQEFDGLHLEIHRFEIEDRVCRSILNSKPDALFCAGETYAVRIGHLLKAAGLRIPEDISLMGLEDRYGNCCFSPPITAIRQDFEQIAAVAAENMYQAVVNGVPPRGAVIPFRLIERESVRNK